MATRDLREVGDRVEGLLTELRGAHDPALTERAEELVRLLMELYGAGLERMMELVAEGDGTLVDRIVDDSLLASLLVLHGLHPVPVETRIRQALDKAQKYAGPVKYLGIDDHGVAHLELETAPQGCPSTAMTVKDAIEKAVSDAAPELGGVELAGLFAPPPPAAGNGTPITLGATKGGNAVPVSIGRAPR
ncbi:MAG: NifU family protein [Acidimicrobiia bacterium]